MTDTPEHAVRHWWMFFGWLLVGVLWATSVAGAASIGLFILPFAGLATWFLVRRPDVRSGMPGLIAAGGLPFFFVAGLNHTPQGTVLRGSNGGPVSGFVRTNPWPWVTVGVLFIVVGVVVFFVLTRRRA
jgi:hypothetical protein